MTNKEATKALLLIRNQLDKLPYFGEKDTTDLEHAYELTYEMLKHLEETK